MADSLRKNLIRLAHANPALRPHLLPLLKSADQNDSDYWIGLEPKHPAIDEAPLAPVKQGKLMSRQEVILKRYVESIGTDAVFEYDDLPSDVQAALRRVKDQETLDSDVARWLGDNNPHSGKWASRRA